MILTLIHASGNNSATVPDIKLKTHLTTEDELEDSHDEHPGDAHQEGQYGGQEETPPFSLPQTFIIKLKEQKFAYLVKYI